MKTAIAIALLWIVLAMLTRPPTLTVNVTVSDEDGNAQRMLKTARVHVYVRTVAAAMCLAALVLIEIYA